MNSSERNSERERENILKTTWIPWIEKNRILKFKKKFLFIILFYFFFVVVL